MLKPEIDSLVPHVSFNRRTFMKAALGTGFAAAVLPVSAQTIHTDSDGLEAGEVAVHSGGTLVPAYRGATEGQDALAGNHRRPRNFWRARTTYRRRVPPFRQAGLSRDRAESV